MRYKDLFLAVGLTLSGCTTPLNTASASSASPTVSANSATSTTDTREWWQKLTPSEVQKLNAEAALKDKAGQSLAEPILAAIEKYRAAEKQFPDKLEALVPKYLDKLSVKDEKNDLELTYSKQDTTYRFSFSYTGFGICLDSYDFETKKWSGGSCIL